MAEIAYETVSKVYDDGTWAVQELDLAIEDGELMVLVGPSGCGKTTALRMLAGLEEISDGIIRIGDRVVNDLSPKERDIAMVFQNYALYPHMTVEDNLAFGLKFRKLPKQEIKEKVHQAASVLQIEEYLDKKPKALSGGQRRRAHGPSDRTEPPGVLDGRAALEPRREAQSSDARRDPRPPASARCDDRLRHARPDRSDDAGRSCRSHASGRLQQVATPQGLYERPVNEFVAGFIGSPSINLLEAELASSNGGLEVRFGEHRLRIDARLRVATPSCRATSAAPSFSASVLATSTTRA